jgi:hypothetical protein
MTKKDRLRRVITLCVHFARNLAYYRALHDHLTNKSEQLWIAVHNNFIDMAVLDWCKLLGDRKGKHSWRTVVADATRFEGDLHRHLRVTQDEFESYVGEMRTYRNKFVAHLDDLAVMNIPFLDRAMAAVEFYHRHVVKHEACPGDLDGPPTDLVTYYDQCFDEAQRIYASAGL